MSTAQAPTITPGTCQNCGASTDPDGRGGFWPYCWPCQQQRMQQRQRGRRYREPEPPPRREAPPGATLLDDLAEHWRQQAERSDFCEGCGRSWPCDPAAHKQHAPARQKHLELRQHWHDMAGAPPFCRLCLHRSPCESAEEHAVLAQKHDETQRRSEEKEAARQRTQEMRAEFDTIKTPAMLLKFYLAQDGQCSVCDDPVDLDSTDKGDKPQILHDIALSKGGTNEEPNLSLGHARCNARQGTKRLAETRALIAAERAAAPYRALVQRSIDILTAQ